MSRNRRRLSAPGTALAERDDRALLRSELQRSLDNEVLLSESFADLAAQMSDPGWIRLSAQFEQEFTPQGLRLIRAACRLYAVKNPLIRRGLSLRQAYVWSQGVEIAARANGKKRREQDVQAVVAAFLTDPGNERAFTGAAARERLERCLGTDGEFFPTMFVRPSTGEVQIRVVGADEIAEIICNPQDRSEPWYYRRRWVQSILSADGSTVQQSMEQFHPALDYQPRVRPKQFGDIKVAWDAPMLHVKVGDLEGWQRGVPDAYAAVDWARAYKEFLEDWARLVKSLSRFAWRLTVKGQQRTQARTKLAAPPVDTSGRVQDVGNVAMIPPEQQLDAIPKSGATIDSESGKPLAAMIAAALDVPLTMLLADPGHTGARAVAQTLDQPTELAMGQRRSLWSGVYQRILKYCIAEAVRAPEGPLKGSILVDAYGRETVKLNGATTADVQIDWPPLGKIDQDRIVASVAAAAATGTLPPEEIARLLLSALGVKNVEELIDAMTDADGTFLWPDPPPNRTPPAVPVAPAPASSPAGPDGNPDGAPVVDQPPTDPATEPADKPAG